MAGIGFELRSALLRGGMWRFLTVSLAGTAVVAGPWLLSMLGIFLIQRFASSVLSGSASLFQAVVVYSYAFSLMAAGGFHYVFSRWISDLVYECRERDAGSALLSFLILTGVASAVLSAAAVLPLRLVGLVPHPTLFAVSTVLLFVGINLNWVLTLFISLLQEYLAIFLVYLGGCLLSFLGALALGISLGVSGGLLGYCLGQWVTAAALYLLTVRRYRPSGLPFRGILGYLSRYRFLFLSGTLYCWASWVDKTVFWFALGTRVPGGWFSVFDPYDIPVFFAMLTLIPGLLHFTVSTEPAFYLRLKAFLANVGNGTYRKIQEKKYSLIRTMYSGLHEQALLQGVCAAVAVLAAPAIASGLFGGNVGVRVLRVTLLAAFFHSLFLSLMILLFYLELYRSAFLATLVFFLVNLFGAAIVIETGSPAWVGTSYLAGAAAGCAVAAGLLGSSLWRIDRILYLRASTPE